MTQSNTSNRDSSQDWTFKTDEEIKEEQGAAATFMIAFNDHDPKTIINLTPNLKMQFYKEGKECGSFDWSTGKMTFEGDADASAQAFLEGIRFYIDSYIESRTINIKYEIDKYFENFK